MDNSGIEEVESEQCVCQACEENMKNCMRKRDMVRWQIQRDTCCVSSCSVMASIRKHPFSWTEMCSSTKIASIDCDSVE